MDARIFSIIGVLLFQCLSAVSQEPLIWAGGIDQTNTYHFSNGQLIERSLDFHIPIESTVAILVDSMNRPLAISNGCQIVNIESQNTIVKIQKGKWAGDVCNSPGLISPRAFSTIIDPRNSRLLHCINVGLNGYAKSKLETRGLYYWCLQYDERRQMEVVKTDSFLIDEMIDSYEWVRHGNGRDWWLLSFTHESQTISKFLLSNGEISLVDQQLVDYFVEDYCPLSNRLCVSPKGDHLVLMNGSCGIYLYRFDRCWGWIDTPGKKLKIPNGDIGRDGTFNGSGDYFYITDWRWLLRVNVGDIGRKNFPVDSISVDSGYTCHRIERIDDKLIMTEHCSRNFYHEIKEEKNGSFLFIPESYKLSVRQSMTLPLVVDYSLRVLESSICDSLTTSIFNSSQNEISVYPNPVSGNTMYIEFGTSGQLNLYSNTGKLIISQKYTSNLEVNLEGLKSGHYILELIDRFGNRSTQKLIKL